jgi:hypothetical protein
MKFDLNSIASAIKSYAGADTRAEKQKKLLESAEETRKRQVIAFADTLRGQGFTDCAAFRSERGKDRGAHHDEVMGLMAACILNKSELAAFQSDQAAFKTVDGKRVYSAKHKAGVKVKNMLNRLLDAAEPYVTGERDAKAEANTPKGAKANTAKDLDVFLEEMLGKMAKRVTDDAKKPAPTGKNHDALRKAIADARKAILALTK